jgi:hypothetical protein
MTQRISFDSLYAIWRHFRYPAPPRHALPPNFIYYECRAILLVSNAIRSLILKRNYSPRFRISGLFRAVSDGYGITAVFADFLDFVSKAKLNRFIVYCEIQFSDCYFITSIDALLSSHSHTTPWMPTLSRAVSIILGFAGYTSADSIWMTLLISIAYIGFQPHSLHIRFRIFDLSFISDHCAIYAFPMLHSRMHQAARNQFHISFISNYGSPSPVFTHALYPLTRSSRLVGLIKFIAISLDLDDDTSRMNDTQYVFHRRCNTGSKSRY